MRGWVVPGAVVSNARLALGVLPGAGGLRRSGWWGGVLAWDPRWEAPQHTTGIPKEKAREHVMGGGEAADEADHHVAQLRAHGFTIVPNVIPPEAVPALREAVLEAQRQHADEHGSLAKDPDCWRDLWPALAEGPAPAGPLAAGLRHYGGNPMLSDLCRLHALHPYLSSPRMLEIARRLLDPHIRIAQIAISKNRPPNSQPLPTGNRLWHTDWPHDLTAYDPLANQPGNMGNVGSVAQPFPCAPMALSTIWFFTDATPRTGGTMAMPVRVVVFVALCLGLFSA